MELRYRNPVMSVRRWRQESTLRSARNSDLSQTIIFLTSHLGGGEITEMMGGGMGFIQPKDKPVTDLNQKLERTAVEAARRNFAPEFMNRLAKVAVFHPLKREELDEVLEIELGQVQKRVLDSTTRPFLFRMRDEGRQFLLQEGTDQRYGPRHLKAPSSGIWSTRSPDCWPPHKSTRAMCCSSTGVPARKS